MRSLRDAPGFGEKKPGDFIWAHDGVLDKMKKDIIDLNNKLQSGFTNLGLRVQLHGDFLGDFEEIKGSPMNLLGENTDGGDPPMASPNQREGAPPKLLAESSDLSVKLDSSSPSSASSSLSKTSPKTPKKKGGKKTLKTRLETIEQLLHDLSISGRQFNEGWEEQKSKVKDLVDNILTLNVSECVWLFICFY
jgi:hypothetical protein